MSTAVIVMKKLILLKMRYTLPYNVLCFHALLPEATFCPPEQDIPLMKSHPLMQASHQCQKDMWCNLLCATEMKYCFSQGQSLHYVICNKDIYIKRRICIKLYFAVTLNQMTVTMTYTCNMQLRIASGQRHTDRKYMQISYCPYSCMQYTAVIQESMNTVCARTKHSSENKEYNI